MTLKGHVTVAGAPVEAEALVSNQAFGFFGGVNPGTGEVIDRWHNLCGQNMKGKVLIYPEGRGSTVGAAIILELARTGCAPAAILNNANEIITATGGVLAKKFYNCDIPMLDQFDCDITERIATGDIVKINPATGEITILQK